MIDSLHCEFRAWGEGSKVVLCPSWASYEVTWHDGKVQRLCVYHARQCRRQWPRLTYRHLGIG